MLLLRIKTNFLLYDHDDFEIQVSIPVNADDGLSRSISISKLNNSLLLCFVQIAH